MKPVYCAACNELLIEHFNALGEWISQCMTAPGLVVTVEGVGYTKQSRKSPVAPRLATPEPNAQLPTLNTRTTVIRDLRAGERPARVTYKLQHSSLPLPLFRGLTKAIFTILEEVGEKGTTRAEMLYRTKAKQNSLNSSLRAIEKAGRLAKSGN